MKEPIKTEVTSASLSYIGGRPVAVVTIHADPRDAVDFLQRIPHGPGVVLADIQAVADQLDDEETPALPPVPASEDPIE